MELQNSANQRWSAIMNELCWRVEREPEILASSKLRKLALNFLPGWSNENYQMIVKGPVSMVR